jgi:F1F0 ATPase subunit 2
MSFMMALRSRSTQYQALIQTMPEALYILIGFLGGFALGAVSYRGLWLTIQRLPRSTRPYRLYYGSKLVRLALVLLGLFALLSLHPAALGAAMLGLYAARFVLLHPHVQKRPA